MCVACRRRHRYITHFLHFSKINSSLKYNLSHRVQCANIISLFLPSIFQNLCSIDSPYDNYRKIFLLVNKMSERSYAILGTGALGGFYGAKLQKAGLDVHFLLRSDYEYVSKFGLVIESKDGNLTLPQVKAYNDVEKMPQCDVVVVALKTTQNHLLPQIAAPVVRDDGVVLVLQNGLAVEEEVAKIVGNISIIGGLCFLCSNKVGALNRIGSCRYKRTTNI